VSLYFKVKFTPVHANYSLFLNYDTYDLETLTTNGDLSEI